MLLMCLVARDIQWIYSDNSTLNHQINDLVLVIRLKSSFLKFEGNYGRYHDLIYHFGIYLSQITTDMFRLSISDHPSSHPDFSWVRDARSLFLCVVFCGSLLMLKLFFFYSPLQIGIKCDDVPTSLSLLESV